MVPSFKIIKDGVKKYYIQRKVWICYPIYELRTMRRNEFFTDLTHYGEEMLSRQEATFKSLDEAYDALHQYSMINGYDRIVVLVRDKF